VRFSSWEKTKILRHELVHAQQWHSFDILMISFVRILFWFNPLLYFYQRRLIQLHEFEADARSVQSDEVDLYCNLLAKAALQANGFTLANHFTQSITLNRIVMMKMTNKRIQLWKIAMVVSCTILFIGLMFNYEPLKAQGNSQEEVFSLVDEVPVWPKNFLESLAKELKYPAEARKTRLQGKTLISFVVEKDGSISAVSLKKGFDKECDEEAIRAFQALNLKWTPGKKTGKVVRTQMILPVQFKL
jgi:TonB family protein